MPELLGRERYELGPRIGYGGMATVYLAHDVKLDRRVAIKVLADNYAGDDEIRKRFMREARLAAKLDHPNVVKVFDVGEDDDDRPYIVMEHVAGGTLGQRLASRKRGLPSAESLRLLSQLCDGLAHAHSKKLVHRDIKPGNLLIRESDGCLKIADFGIAKAAEETRLTRPGRVIGTDRYMAPEQLVDGKITPATDVYACGVVAEELLPESRPPELQAIIERCLREDPVDRFPDADALGEAIASVDGNAAPVPLRRVRTQAETGTKTRKATTTRRSRDSTAALVPPRRRFPGRLAATIAILAIATIGLVLAIGSGGSDPPPTIKTVAPPTASVPNSSDPADQARGLAEFLRAQARQKQR
jgi:eukaryotic-like serine/threonine-protein kinase